jgi:hypothetical protein
VTDEGKVLVLRFIGARIGGQDGHAVLIHPFALPVQGLPFDAFVQEAAFLVDAPGAWVERVHAQTDAVQPDRVETVSDHGAGSLGAIALTDHGRIIQQDSEVHAAVVPVEIVQHRLTRKDECNEPPCRCNPVETTGSSARRQRDFEAVEEA